MRTLLGLVLGFAAFGCASTPNSAELSLQQKRLSRTASASQHLIASCERDGEPRERAWLCFTAADYFERGVFGIPQDLNRASELREKGLDVLEASCDRGSVSDCTAAAIAIGSLLRPDAKGSTFAPDAAGWMVEYARHGCDGGDKTGCAFLGLLYQGNRFVRPNGALSQKYTDRACVMGHSGSCLALASQANGAATVSAYERACEAGSGYGCAAAAQHYRRGVGVVRSLKRADELFGKGCDLGNPAACLMGAEMNEMVEMAPRRAARLAWEACQLDIPDGCVLLGTLVEQEYGPARAIQVYHRACKMEDARGCEAEKRAREAAGKEPENGGWLIELDGE
ncbi:MAG: sel1 repeat family protein [Polyangiaceae bacterium]|nr:sel1 repeat family protein [Polyangiaceae bacterium]